MPSPGSITKTIRLSPQDREYIEGIMRENGVTWSGAVHYLVNESNISVNHRQDIMDKSVEDDIKRQCIRNKISTHDFYREIAKIWKKGEFRIDGDKVRNLGHFNIEKLVEICYINNIKPQEVINRFTENLEKGLNR